MGPWRPPPGPGGGNGGSIWFNLVQLGSDFGKQALRGGVGAVLGTEAHDLTDALLFLFLCDFALDAESRAIFVFLGPFLELPFAGRAGILPLEFQLFALLMLEGSEGQM